MFGNTKLIILLAIAAVVGWLIYTDKLSLTTNDLLAIGVGILVGIVVMILARRAGFREIPSPQSLLKLARIH